MNLKAKVLAGVAFLAISAAAIGGIGIYNIDKLGAGLQINAEYTRLVETLMHADMMHDALRGDVLLALSVSDPAFGTTLEAVKADLKEHTANFLQSIAEVEKSTVDAEINVMVKDTKAVLVDYVRSANEIVTMAGVNPVTAKSLFGGFMEKFSALEERMETLSNSVAAKAEAVTKSGADASRSASWTMLACMFAAFLAGAVTIAIVILQVLRPLGRVTADLGKLASGETDFEPYGVARKDEIGLIARAFAKFRDNEIEARLSRKRAEEERLRDEEAHRKAQEEAIAKERRLVQQAVGVALERLAGKDLTYRIKDDLPEAYKKLHENFNFAMEQLEGVVSKLTSSTNNITSGTREISTASNELSNRTESQAVSLEETAAAVAQITGKVKQAAASATKTKDVASVAQVEATKSSAVVKRAIDAMAAIEKSSNQITQITSVIDEIAFQTNLLALNAGVEAARAGDGGKGFAVVAQEVRALAQRSAEAAKEIKSLIGSALTQVQLGVKLVDETGTSLAQITGRISEINSLMAEVVAAAEEQASSLQQINLSVDEMDKNTQENAAMVQQTTTATSSLVQQSDDLNAMISTFVTNARDVLAKAAEPPGAQNQHETPRRPVVRQPAPMASRAKPAPAKKVANGSTAEEWSEF